MEATKAWLHLKRICRESRAKLSSESVVPRCLSRPLCVIRSSNRVVAFHGSTFKHRDKHKVLGTSKDKWPSGSDLRRKTADTLELDALLPRGGKSLRISPFALASPFVSMAEHPGQLRLADGHWWWIMQEAEGEGKSQELEIGGCRGHDSLGLQEEMGRPDGYWPRRTWMVSQITLLRPHPSGYERMSIPSHDPWKKS